MNVTSFLKRLLWSTVMLEYTDFMLHVMT